MPSTLRLYTDFVCPFCFIAEASTVPALLGEFDLTLEWCGFELHPTTPRGGLPLSALFPGVDPTRLHAQTRQFAASFGVGNFDPPNRLQNSRRALAIAEYARDASKLEAYKQRAFDAHWREAKDLENFDDLRAIAVDAGLDPERAVAAADDEAYLARVDAKQAEARARGIRGIPTFILGDERVQGCQPFPVLAAAAVRAGVARRSGPQ